MLKFFLLFAFVTLTPASLQAAAESSTWARRVLNAADHLLEMGQVSYAWGGSHIGEIQDCHRCQVCLQQRTPKSKQQLSTCPECKKCSLDCSHFIKWAFEAAGLTFPYLTTKTMLALSPEQLLQRYHMLDLRRAVPMIQPGDLVVYEGHVVLVEKLHRLGIADIVHATSGKDLQGPGQGIQRQRQVRLGSFRGPLQRILRHRQLMPQDAPPTRAKLRPVPKRGPLNP